MMNIKPCKTIFSEENAKWMAGIASLAQSNIDNLPTTQPPPASAANLITSLDEAFDRVEQYLW